ncbi:MAG: SRPBCC family protein [Polaribacter sp.]|nr:SRPBCC family protein [Polaribacter sp.]
MNKIAKIIFKLSAVLLLIFLATGLLIKETSYQVKIQINKPLVEVFKVFNDSSKWQDWMPELRSVEVVEARPGVVGSVYKMLLENEGEMMTATKKIMAYVPEEKTTFYFRVDEVLKTDDYSFLTRDHVTIITKSVVCKSDSYLLQCLLPYFKRTFISADQKYLDNFKAYLEKD